MRAGAARSLQPQPAAARRRRQLGDGQARAGRPAHLHLRLTADGPRRRSERRVAREASSTAIHPLDVPQRLLDTRQGPTRRPGRTRSRSACGGATPGTIVLNATVDRPATPGWVALYPSAPGLSRNILGQLRRLACGERCAGRCHEWRLHAGSQHGRGCDRR